MNTTSGISTKPTTSFWIIASIALIWNLMGLLVFIGNLFITPEMLQQLPEKQQALYTDVPLWATLAFAIAVVTGTLGCITLLLKKSFSKILFIVSLLAVFVQNIHAFINQDAFTVLGPTALIMPLLVIGIGGFLIGYSAFCQKKGWIS